MKKIVLVLFLQLFTFNLLAQYEVKKETHLYSVKGLDSLKLDRYYIENYSNCKEEKPAIIFMFGGAFYSGVRDRDYYIPCFEYYAQKGYEVFSIDYRLGLKNAKKLSVKRFSEFVHLVNNTINIAVEDLYDATSFIVDKSKDWGIDETMIIPFGSSSGGISVLHAEYYSVNGDTLARKLPMGFKYGGVISMAGSIFSTSGKLSWGGDVAPILLFHGSSDRNVPYNKKTIFKYGFHGSKSIVKSLNKIKSPYYFYTFEGAGHEIAGSPMNNNREDIDAFLVKLVKEKQPLEITKLSIDTSKPKNKKRIKIKDYINANFSPQGGN